MAQRATSRRWVWAGLGALAVAAMGAAVVAFSSSQAVAAQRLEPVPPAPQLQLAAPGTRVHAVAMHPQGPAPAGARPTITFDRPVVPLATPEELEKLPAPATLTPALPGAWRWLGSSTVEFVPEKPLPLSTAFHVAIRADLRGADGASLEGPAAFDFETPRPQAIEVAPHEGWSWLERTPTLAVTFDQPVTGLEGALALTVAGRPVALRLTRAVTVLDEELAQAPAAERRWLEARRGQDHRTRYELQPTAPLPPASEVELRVGSDGVRGAEGPLTGAAAKSWRWRTYGPMAIAGARACLRPSWDEDRSCPYGPLVLLTSNTADAKGLRARLSIEPAVEVDWDRVEAQAPMAWDPAAPPYVAVPGKFRPGTSYRVKVAAGLADEFGQAAPAFEATFATTDLPSEFDLGVGRRTSLQLLEAAGDGALPLRSSNVKALELRFWKLGASELAALLAAPERKLPSSSPRELRLETGAARNTVKTQPLSIRELLGGARAGLFALEARDPEGGKRARADKLLGQLTDLAVHARLGSTSGAVWVTRVSDGKPVEGAEVVLHDRAGAARWRGRTDADGLVRDAGLGAFAEARAERRRDDDSGKRVVSATKDGDTALAVASWSDGLWPGEFNVSTDSSGGAPTDLGTLFAERGIYRPGETVHLLGLVRYRARGEIRTPPAGAAVKLEITNARGAPVLAKELALSRYGTFHADVPVPEDAPLGSWSASAKVTVEGAEVHVGGSFRVEAYRAPQFRVDVTAPAPQVAAGDPVRAQVMARYLFGAALADAPVRWSAVRRTIDFQPPGHEGFEFGVASWWWDDGAPRPSREVFASGTGRTDALGALTVEAGKAEAPADRTWTYELEAEVTDLGRQAVADRTSLTVHPAELYAGVRRPAGFAVAGKPLELELVAVTPAGERRPAKVTVEVRRREWKWIRKKVAGGLWTTVSEPVEERVGGCTASPGAEPARCAVTPPKPGLHVLEARLTDARGRQAVTRTSTYVVGPGWVAWQRDDTDRVELVPDRARYEVGQTAHVLVKSPYPAAEALLTVEREGVLSARRVTLEGAATVLDVPVGEEGVPNLFVGLVLTRGRVAGEAPTATDDPGRPGVKVGYVELQVEKKGKRLAVAVAPDARDYRPRGKVKVDLTVKDAAGRPAQAEVAVWAVDEAVLRLTGYTLPDLVEAIHPPRGLAVRAGESLLGLVERKLFAEKGLAAGGGGGGPEGATLRNRFQTTPLFAPGVETDAAGHAQVSFELPDNLTTYRLLAVAVTPGDLAGGGESSITVSKPLLALPALPRAARAGDRFEAGVVVHAPGAKVSEVEVTAEAEGVKLDGPASRKLGLPGGKPREVRFAFVAERPGQAVLRFRVRGGGETDGVEGRFPVTLPTALEATAIAGETSGTAGEKLVLPRGVREDAGGLELTLASSALGAFAGGMTQLVEYPYGCLEQLSSRLVPFVALRELAAQGVVPAAGWLLPDPGTALPGAVVDRDPDAVVRRTVKAIEARQAPDGGYRFWDESSCVDPWTSAYAIWSLDRAARAGYPVDRAALNRGLRWLEGTVLAGRPVRCGAHEEVPRDPTRVFALFTLARAGSPRASYHAELYGRRGKLPLFSQAMLADALARGGDRDRARGLLQELLNHAQVTGAEVHLEEPVGSAWEAPWSSDARSTAMALQAALAIQPDHPYVSRMVTWLGRARRPDGRFRNTQEASYTLTAVSELVRVREAATPDFTGRVTLGGRELAAQPYHGRSLEITRVRIPMADLLRSGGARELPLEFRRDGAAGTLHYGALLRAAPAAPPETAAERGLFVQRWFEPWRGGGQVHAAQAGDVLRLRARVGTAQERNYVVIEIPVPSGLEAVDTSLASTARLPGEVRRGEQLEEGDDEGPGADDRADDGAWTFWSPFNRVELRDDRVLLFADWLPAGLHTFTLPVRATTPGRFLLAPAHGEEMYAPEVNGRSEGGRFEVSAPEEVVKR